MQTFVGFDHEKQNSKTTQSGRFKYKVAIFLTDSCKIFDKKLCVFKMFILPVG